MAGKRYEVNKRSKERFQQTYVGYIDPPIRDILTAEIPVVLRAEIYASAALLGAAVHLAGASLTLYSAHDGFVPTLEFTQTALTPWNV